MIVDVRFLFGIINSSEVSALTRGQINAPELNKNLDHFFFLSKISVINNRERGYHAKGILMFLRRFVALLYFATILLSPASILADSAATHVVISELSTGTATSANQEFIELYNPTNHDISLAGWTAEYKSSTSIDAPSSWTKHATLTGSIKSYGFYLIAPMAYFPNADADWSATLAASAGHARLRDGAGAVVDRIGYGATANAPEASSASAPSAGQSIERIPGRLDPLAGNATDTDNNAADFILRASPEPQDTSSAIEHPSPLDDTTADVNVPSSETDQPSAPATYAAIIITELLPNPMSPLTDAHDEYIELYNPTDSEADLTGFELRTGTGFHDHYTLPALTLGSGQYLALYSSQTKLGMVNTGGAVELLDPLGTTIYTTPSYDTAGDGQSWSLLDGEWAWTLQTTPSQGNVFVNPIISASVATPSVAKKIKAAPKGIAVAKPKTATKSSKIAAKKPPKVKKLGTTKLAAAQVKPPIKAISAAPWLIATLILLTIGYAAYEFRHDIRNHYYQLRSHRRAR